MTTTMAKAGSTTQAKCLPRFTTPRDPSRMTLGPAVGQVAVRLGYPLMPWQLADVLDVALELDPDGTYHYDEVVLLVPRQSGKTFLVLALAVHRLVVMARKLGRQRLTYTAQLRAKARLKLERDFSEVLRAAGSFTEITHIRNRPKRSTEWKLSLNNGAENIQFGRGNYLQIDAPSRTGGHGDTLDVGVIDEAFAHADDTIETGMEPSMATRALHQLWVLSTAGDAQSKYLWRKVLAGRKACETGDHGRTAYFEWSAPDDAEPGDPATWAACSPALGVTIPERFLEGQWDKAVRGGQEGIDKFRRSYLNQWPETPVLEDEAQFSLIVADDWAACADEDHDASGQLAYALDVDSNAKGEEWCSISASDGVHLEDVTPHNAVPGTTWVVAAVVKKRDAGVLDEVWLDPKGTAAKLIDPLEAAGVIVRKIKPEEFVQASMQIVDAVTYGTVWHLNQPTLNRSVAVLEKRDVADGQFRISRSLSSGDIGPFVAAMEARWAAGQPRTNMFDGPLVAVT